MQVQSGHQFHAMILDRLGADFEDVRDLLGVLTFRDELENLALADCQLVERGILVGDLIHGGMLEESRGDVRMQINFLVNDAFQGGFGLLGSSFGLFGPRPGLLSPCLCLFRSDFGLFRSSLGLLGSRLRLLCPRLCLFDPCLAAGRTCRLLLWWLHRLSFLSNPRQPLQVRVLSGKSEFMNSGCPDCPLKQLWARANHLVERLSFVKVH